MKTLNPESAAVYIYFPVYGIHTDFIINLNDTAAKKHLLQMINKQCQELLLEPSSQILVSSSNVIFWLCMLKPSTAIAHPRSHLSCCYQH